MNIGYARVSTQEQNLQMQHEALKKAGCTNIYEDVASGTNLNRSELSACLKALRPGDTLVVWKLDRLSRAVKQIIILIDSLNERGIFFKSINENIENITAIGKMQFQILAVLAEFERNLISERTHAGLATARARGRFGGRKNKLSKKQIEQLNILYKSGEVVVSDIARQFDISRTSVYNYIKEE